MSDEIILCITKEAGARVAADLSDLNMLQKLAKELPHIYAYSRKHLDKRDNGEGNPMGDPKYWQLLPYMAIVHDNNVFTYRRTKKVGEQRLAGNTSIGIGGHVAVDRESTFDRPAYTHAEDFYSDMNASIRRELEEELGISYDYSDANDVRFIVDHTNDVGKLHLGLGLSIEVPEPVACIEQELESIGHLSYYELLKMDSHENWTNILLKP